ncbi:MAG TPA: hypothetical protein PK231_09260 [Acidocella sp.]|nr:hypothetical protein [Acidocella sp.]
MKDVLRDTWRDPKLWMVDARIWALVPFVIIGLHVWKIIVFGIAVSLLILCEAMYGLSLRNAVRLIIASFLPRHRQSRSAIRRRRVLDYGAQTKTPLFEDGDF